MSTAEPGAGAMHAPVWSSAYRRVSSQVTLCGSCLAKKSSAAARGECLGSLEACQLSQASQGLMSVLATGT